MRILITYATLTGNTAVVAEHVADKLAEKFVDAEIVVEECLFLEPDSFKDLDLLVMAASTWGEGDQNPIGEDFTDWLSQNSLELQGTKGLFIGLGERSYENFGNAIHSFEEIFNGFGVEQVGKAHKVDGYPDEDELASLDVWLEKSITSIE